MLPFKQAVKFPIILSKNLKFYSLSGKIILIGKIKTGVVRFGFFGEDNMHWRSCNTLIKIDGTLLLDSDIHFANGIVLRVEKDATLEIGNNVKISNEVKLICYNKIKINSNTRIAWESQIIDTTFHFIRNIKTKDYANINGEIHVGSNNWIGNRCSIMKGTTLPDNCIIASGSLTNKNYQDYEYCILAGTPVQLTKKNVYRVLDEEEKIIKGEINSGKI